MVSLAMKRVLIGVTAAVVMLGWLQLAPAIGFPVTAPAPMLDRMLGAQREAGPVGWTLLLLGTFAFAAAYLFVVEARTRGSVAPMVYALAGFLLAGAVVMPLIGLIQGPPPVGDPANDPMRANFFMLNLGLGAAVESLVGWVLFGAVLAAGRTMEVRRRTFLAAAGAGLLVAAIAFAGPGLAMRAQPASVVEGHVTALPPGPVFISILELPQPPGAVLGPHQHVAGFVYDAAGTATMVFTGTGAVDVRPGEGRFLAVLQPHDHENRAAVPLAIALSAAIVILTSALLNLRARRAALFLGFCLIAASSFFQPSCWLPERTITS
jgi:mannose-6-phosphate isomerase-like protein (cupin superfamily)